MCNKASVTYSLNSMSRATFCVSDTEVLHHVKPCFATTDSVAEFRALSLHFLVLWAEVVAVQTPVKVVPQLRVVARLTWCALCILAGSAVSGAVSSRFAFFALENFTCYTVLVFIGGNLCSAEENAREQEQDWQGELWRELLKDEKWQTHF